MARAHAASACVQSDSIKGLAQSIAKPAYHRLLIAEPALRRAVPTLIIAFLITICLGAFVQVVDQSRQKRASVKRDLTAVADLLAERLDHFAAVRQDRAATIERLQPCCPVSFRHGASPPAGMSSSPAPTSACSPASRSMPCSATPTASSTSSARRCRSPRAERKPPLPTSPCPTAMARWRSRASSDRCPARSSSSRRRSIRSGGRTRHCR